MADCITTQVTFADKSETMKVLSATPAITDPPPQLWTWRYCREKYQTQAYKVPLVTDPRKGSCWPTPAPRCMSPRPMRSPCGQGQALRLQCRLSAVLSVITISSFSTRSQQSSTVSTEAAAQTQAAA